MTDTRERQTGGVQRVTVTTLTMMVVGGMVALGVLDPHHVVEQQIVGVGRCKPAVRHTGRAHQNLAEPANLGVNPVLR